MWMRFVKLLQEGRQIAASYAIGFERTKGLKRFLGFSYSLGKTGDGWNKYGERKVDY